MSRKHYQKLYRSKELNTSVEKVAFHGVSIFHRIFGSKFRTMPETLGLLSFIMVFLLGSHILIQAFLKMGDSPVSGENEKMLAAAEEVAGETEISLQNPPNRQDS